MQSGREDAKTMEPNVSPSTVVPHLWWHGGQHGAYAASLHVMTPEGASKPPAPECKDAGHSGAEVEQTQPEDSSNEASNASKRLRDTGPDAVNGNSGHQNMQSAPSAVLPLMSECFVPHKQLELGHSIPCVYPHPDPFFGGMLAAYGTQALVHPQFLGMPQNRMPLPLEMAEEPVYVNAKQYHGILRRRQSRAKAELQKKLVKLRKPYLHESRHQHAMRRARGCGGRFLNTKKADGNSSVPSAEKAGSSGPTNSVQSVSSSGSENMPSDKQEMNSSKAQSIVESNNYANSTSAFQQNMSFCISDFNSMSSDRREDGDCSGKQWNGMRVNHPPKRAVTIQ